MSCLRSLALNSGSGRAVLNAHPPLEALSGSSSMLLYDTWAWLRPFRAWASVTRWHHGHALPT